MRWGRREGQKQVGTQHHQSSGCGHQASFQLEFTEASRIVHLKDRGWTLLPLPVGEGGLGGINSPLLWGKVGAVEVGGTQDVQGILGQEDQI